MRSIVGGAQLVALIVLGCSKDAAAPRQPVSQADYVLGFCGHSAILDADGRLWFESGCEDHSSGTNFVRDATAAEISRVTTAVSALPESSNVPCAAPQPQLPDEVRPQRTLGYRAGGHSVVLVPCVGDPPPLLAAFDSAWTTLDGLVSHETEVDAATE
jgi:hypothetical protein